MSVLRVSEGPTQKALRSLRDLEMWKFYTAKLQLAADEEVRALASSLPSEVKQYRSGRLSVLIELIDAATHERITSND